MSETKKILKWWWAWAPEKLENWLENMEKQGWRLFNSKLALISFELVKDTPKNARYCLDYQEKFTPEYKSIFEDAGWELISSGMGWYIWRREYTDVRPEIYTDADSLIARNTRLIRYLTAVFAAQIPLITINLHSNVNYMSPFMLPLTIIYFGSIFLLAYAIFKLSKYNKKLKVERK